MEEITGGQVTATPTQPAPLPVDFTNVPKLTDADVRGAIESAEKQGIDVEKLTVSEMADVQKGNLDGKPLDAPKRMSPDQPINPNAMKLEVPQQFQTPDGEADVEKIKAETKRLDEATQQKEEAIQKTTDDYLREYKEKQTKFRNLPNPEKLGERLRAQEPASPTGLNEQQIHEIIMNDFRVDPVGTVSRLAEAVAERKLEPFNEEKRERAYRSNVDALAKDDPRILDNRIFAAINKELDANPQFWALPNPHRAAWLEVKERMRLGEPPQRAASAQPSRPPSPILGAGAPPSAPSPSTGNVSKSVLETLDPRDKKQEALGDAMLRKALERKTY